MGETTRDRCRDIVGKRPWCAIGRHDPAVCRRECGRCQGNPVDTRCRSARCRWRRRAQGIHAFIEALDPGTWAIVTSAPRALAEVRLRAVNLPIPEVMITAEDVQRGKPDPQGFLLGAQRLGVSIGECLVFEDSPAGVAAAKAAGAHVAIVGGLVPGTEGNFRPRQLQRVNPRLTLRTSRRKCDDPSAVKAGEP